MREDRLELVLESIGDHLDTAPPASDDSGPPEPSPRPWSRRVLALAAVAATVVMAVVLVPSTRAAVADWLGIGSTRIEQRTDAPSRPSVGLADDLEPLPIDQAETELDLDLAAISTTPWGRFDEVLAMPEGGVLLTWPERSATLWIHPRGADPAVHLKQLGPDATFEFHDTPGDGALVILGEHTLSTPHRQVAAGTVVLWTDDSFEYRLEADHGPQELIGIAHAVADALG